MGKDIRYIRSLIAGFSIAGYSSPLSPPHLIQRNAMYIYRMCPVLPPVQTLDYAHLWLVVLDNSCSAVLLPVSC